MEESFNKFMALLQKHLLWRGQLDYLQFRGVDMYQLTNVRWAIKNTLYIYKTSNSILLTDTEAVFNIWSIGREEFTEDRMCELIDEIYDPIIL